MSLARGRLPEENTEQHKRLMKLWNIQTWNLLSNFRENGLLF